MVTGLTPVEIQAYSTVVLAVFTIVLAGATIWYAIQAKSQIEETSSQTTEMKKTRELRHEPKMVAGLKPDGPNFEIGFVNIGGGISHDVEAEYWVEGLEQYKREWGGAVHLPEDIQRIGIPLDDSSIGVIGMSDKIKSGLNNEDEDQLTVRWSYKNSRGDKFEETQKISMLEEMKKRSNSTEFYTGNERSVRF